MCKQFLFLLRVSVIGLLELQAFVQMSCQASNETKKKTHINIVFSLKKKRKKGKCYLLRTFAFEASHSKKRVKKGGSCPSETTYVGASMDKPSPKTSFLRKACHSHTTKNIIYIKKKLFEIVFTLIT